ncbi:MAG: hypothetical protein H7Z16_07835 [Pyrinomonadaceae bacterium]|nr:hypothetical protein [Pyrinomonadaceae bacterium]
MVYSVLAGLAFDKSFDFLATSQWQLADAILVVAVFFIVLDNWIYLHLYIRVIDVELVWEVVLYLLAALSYSCIPFLYLARSTSSAIPLDAPGWLLVNLFLICIIDTITKCTTLLKMRRRDFSTLTPAEKRLTGAYAFYAFTGPIYALLIGGAVIGLHLASWGIIKKSLIVVAGWLLIRLIDRLVVPLVADAVTKILGRGTVKV